MHVVVVEKQARLEGCRSLRQAGLQKVKADNCERAKANKALMDSGVRVSHTKPNGEREILDDAGRAAELKRIQTVMETNCN